jgi:phosphatase NudJ
MSQRYKPNVTVACIVQCQDKFLMVEEWIDGEQRFNQPAGHLEAGESLVCACEREVLEETGLKLDVDKLIGIYQFSATEELAFLRFTFAARLEAVQPLAPRDCAIRAAHWLTFDEIRDKSSKLRSPLVLQCIQDYLAGQWAPLNILSSDYLTTHKDAVPGSA